MDIPMSNFHFKFMSFGYKFRDLFLPRRNILKEAGMKPGFYVLKGVLEELHRVLKPNGILSFSDHHMKEDEIGSK
jgi:predicted methyltransferase